MAIRDYIDDATLESYIRGDNVSNANYTVSKIMSTRTNGIEGLPYQFMDTVDRRVPGTEGAEGGAGVGRKYGERIFARLPLLFLTPCEPLFMDDFDENSKTTVAEALLGGKIDDIAGTLGSHNGKYYSVNFSYDSYYEYLNTMLSCLSVYLGIYNETIPIQGKGENKIGTMSWQNELNDSFRTFFSSAENVIFYLDGLESVSESFSNDTTESSLASQINGYTDNINELRFLFGTDGSFASKLMNYGNDITGKITSTLSGAASALAGGIIGSLADKGVSSVLNGGKIIFPEIWNNSDFSRSYSIDIKLRSPDHDSLSIFLNVLKPYCKLLALTLPRNMPYDSAGNIDPNAYYSPFLVKAYSKGLFNIDMGIISSMSVTKGALCCWNDDGLPTQIDISLEIKDLYSHMAMTGVSLLDSMDTIKGVVNNTAYMDFLANMAGLNIAQMEVGRRIAMAYYLTQYYVGTAATNVYTRFENAVSNVINLVYNFT